MSREEDVRRLFELVGRFDHLVEWAWDPDTADESYVVDYAFLLRDGADMKAVHDHHTEGLFTRAVWEDVLKDSGYHVETMPRPFNDVETGTIFVCRRP